MKSVLSFLLVLLQLLPACAPTGTGSQFQGTGSGIDGLLAIRNSSSADDVFRTICLSYGLGPSCFENWDSDLGGYEAAALKVMEVTGLPDTAERARRFCSLVVNPGGRLTCGPFEDQLIMTLAKKGRLPLRTPEVSYALAATGESAASSPGDVAVGFAVGAVVVLGGIVALAHGMNALQPAGRKVLEDWRKSNAAKRGMPQEFIDDGRLK